MGNNSQVDNNNIYCNIHSDRNNLLADGVKSKPCKRCAADLPLSSFGKHKFQPDGLHYYCKSCTRDQREKRRGEFAT